MNFIQKPQKHSPFPNHTKPNESWMNRERAREGRFDDETKLANPGYRREMDGS